MRTGRRRYYLAIAIAIGILCCGAAHAADGIITVGGAKPKGGVISLSLKGLATFANITITVPPGTSDADKVKLIRDEINKQAPGFEAHTILDANYNPTSSVLVHETAVAGVGDLEMTRHSDTTGEIDGFKPSGQAWSRISFTLPPSGDAFPGTLEPAEFNVGTELYMAHVLTPAGTTLQNIASAAAADLDAHGVPTTLDANGLGFQCRMARNVTFFAGANDTSLGYSMTVYPDAPAPAQSVTPPFLTLVGSDAGAADAAALYSVLVRDSTGAPLESTTVAIDFSGCSDLRPAAVQLSAGLGVDCAAGTVSAITDASGLATFAVMGSVLPQTPASGYFCARVLAGFRRVLLGTASVAVYDLDASNGLGANDFSRFLADFGSGGNPPRSDFDGSGAVGANDLSILGSAYVRGGSSASGSRCDLQSVVKPVVTAGAGGLNATWTNCVTAGGTSLATFNCLSNTGSNSLVFSVVPPPGVTALTGFEATVLVETGNPVVALPAWWRFDSCRPTSLSIGSPVATACGDVFDAGAAYVYGMVYPATGPSSARIRVLGAVELPVAVSPGSDIGLFRMTVNRTKTTGGVSCSDCSTPVGITLESVKLVQGDASGPADVLLTSPATSNHVSWQQAVAGVDPAAVASGLALARAPSEPGQLVVDFSLTSAAPASLALFDLGGRRLSLDLFQALAPGPHRWTVAATGQLPPGMYIVRLAQGALSRSLKAPVLR
jgi:hypothetical protein